MKKTLYGITIFEMMLVLALASLFIVMGLRQYQMYKTDRDIAQVQAVVNSLFQAASQYYKVNCSTLGITTNPFPIPISGLVSNNFLMNLKWPPIVNGLVDRSLGNYGYLTQLNLINSTRSSVNAQYTTWGLPTPNITLQTTGNIYVWRIQVSVALASGINANFYKGRLGADCTSSLNGGTVDPCSNNNPGNYVVWERLPSFASPNTASPLWLTMYRIQQSNQLYTNDDMYAASNSTWGNTSNNYLCGG